MEAASGSISQTGRIAETCVWVSVRLGECRRLVCDCLRPAGGWNGPVSGCVCHTGGVTGEAPSGVSHIGGVTRDVPGGNNPTGAVAGAGHSHKGLWEDLASGCVSHTAVSECQCHRGVTGQFSGCVGPWRGDEACLRLQRSGGAAPAPRCPGRGSVLHRTVLRVGWWRELSVKPGGDTAASSRGRLACSLPAQGAGIPWLQRARPDLECRCPRSRAPASARAALGRGQRELPAVPSPFCPGRSEGRGLGNCLLGVLGWPERNAVFRSELLVRCP